MVISVNRLFDEKLHQQDLITKTEQACRNISHNAESNCNNLLLLVNGIIRQGKKKKNTLYAYIGHHDHITKRSISFAGIAQFEETLYDKCDLDCIKKFDFGIKREVVAQ